MEISSAGDLKNCAVSAQIEFLTSLEGERLLNVRAGVDLGGTFADVVGFNECSGTLSASKIPSTPGEPDRAMIDGARRILDDHGLTPAVHVSTTISSNGRLLSCPATAVSRSPNGCSCTGQVQTQLPDEGIARIVEDVLRLGLKDIGICLPHYYANPEHEETLRAAFGGLVPSGTAQRHPVQTILSHPSAGALSGLRLGQQAGFHNVISIDVGGTSADVSLSQKGRLCFADESEVARQVIKISMIEIETVCAGGGSLAWARPNLAWPPPIKPHGDVWKRSELTLLIHPDGVTENLPPKVNRRVGHGDRLLSVPPGGGGSGTPQQRVPEAVLRDVVEGLIPVKTARETYRVVITPEHGIDTGATARLRGVNELVHTRPAS